MVWSFVIHAVRYTQATGTFLVRRISSRCPVAIAHRSRRGSIAAGLSAARSEVAHIVDPGTAVGVEAIIVAEEVVLVGVVHVDRVGVRHVDLHGAERVPGAVCWRTVKFGVWVPDQSPSEDRSGCRAHPALPCACARDSPGLFAYVRRFVFAIDDGTVQVGLRLTLVISAVSVGEVSRSCRR